MCQLSLFRKAFTYTSLVGLVFACASGKDPADGDTLAALRQKITYPFVTTPKLGTDGRHEKFVIRSIVGGREYVIEIPHAGDDYDIEVPLAELNSKVSGKELSKTQASPVNTDRKITAQFPTLSQQKPEESFLLDRAFGVSPSDEPEQGPSYTLGLARINEFYRKRDYERALIELDNLITYYPTSPKLHKMRGSVLYKLQEWSLAERAWKRALELNPKDKVLQKAIARLEKKQK